MPIAFTLAGTFSGAPNDPNVLNNPTSLQFGPDGRLYVSEQNGDINAFTVEQQADGSWIATSVEVLQLADGSSVVKSIQNHNDDGTESGATNRQVTGIVVTEDDLGNIVLYVSSSDPRISSNNDVGLDTNSGIVSKVMQTDTGWEVVDLVRGLPRSEENHSVNGMILSEDGTKLLLQVGGFTNNGAASSFFSYTNEYALSGAVLELDLLALDALPDQIDPEGGQGDTPRFYKYDLPTLDDPNVGNVTDGVGEDADGMDEDGPFGGNDGLNMAILPSDAPLRLYADGTRNAYDLAQGANGLIYTVDNGSNGNLGAEPNTEINDSDGDGILNEAISTPNDGGQGEGEPFHQIVEGGYYYHANPVRSNQNMEWTVYGNDGQPDPSVTVNQIDDISALVPTKLIQDGVMTEGYLIDPTKFAVAPNQTLQDLIDFDAANGTNLAQERLLLSGTWINSNDLDNIADPDGSGSGQTTIAQLGSSTNGIIVYDSGGAAFGGSIDGAVFVTQFNDNLTLLNVNDLGTDLEPIFEEGPDGIFGTADDVIQDADGILQVANNGTGVPLGNPLDVTQGPDGTLWVAEIGSNEITVLAPTVVLDPTSEDADFDGILNKDDPFSRDATNGTSVAINAAAPTVWEFSQDAGDTTPGPDGFGGGLTGAMINGETDFEAFYLEEDPNGNPGDLRLDNVKFVTAAAGGTTTIEEVSNGDPFQNNNSGEYLFHTGFVLDEAVETFTVTWVVANPGAVVGGPDITNNSQQIGGYLGDGTQSNYLKIVAIATNNPTDGSAPTANIQIALEEAVSQGGFPETFSDQVLQTVNLPANGIFDNSNLVTDSSITFELLIDLSAKTATPQATYQTTTGPVTITGGLGDVIDLAPGGQDSKVLTTFLGGAALPGGEQQGIAAGLFSSNTGSADDTFQAVFDSISVSATEADIPPVAADDDVTTQTNNAIEIPVATLLANDTDANSNEVLTVAAVSNAVNGEVALANGVVTFTPDADFQGDATFEYTVEDASGLTDTGLVTVSVSDLTVLFRLNAAGDTIAALPNDPYGSNLEWLGLGTGTGTAPAGIQSDFEWSVTSTNTSVHNIAGRDTSVPDYVPQELYAVERWDPGAAPDMQWTFGGGALPDLPNGTYTVNILAGNGFGGTSEPGQRVFDITIEDEVAFDNVDLSDQFGHQTGGFFSFEVQVTDGQLNVELGRDGVDSVENPTINAIEILQGSVSPQLPTIDIVSGDVTVNEDAGTIQVSVLTSETVPAGPGLDFTYVITGVTAFEGSDYEPNESLVGNSSGSVFTGTGNIAGSSSDFTIDIDILNDTDFENAETLTVEIVSVGPGFEIGDGFATITIADDDAAQGTAIYRINSGGPMIIVGDDDVVNPTDPDLDWAADQNPTPNSALVAGGENTFGTNVTIDATTVPEAPAGIFSSERWDPDSPAGTTPEMQYEFAADPGTYTVNLYMVEGNGPTSSVGARVFDVAVEGTVPTVFDDIDPSAISQSLYGAGNFNSAFVLSHTLSVTDGILDLDFQRSVENPAIRGIEILAVDGPPTYEPPLDDLFGAAVEIEDTGDAPSGPVTLLQGSNVMSATQEGETSGLNGVRDRDYFTVSVPEGFQLTGIVLNDYDVTQNPDTAPDAFFAFQEGQVVTTDPVTGANVGDLTGALIYGAGNVGQNLLEIMRDGFSDPATSPDPILSGFDQPLTGDLTFWLNQGAGPSTATLDFIVEPLSEPAPIVAAINAGGPALTQDGIDFAADSFFLSPSNTFTDGNAGNGEQTVFDETVFETERFGGATEGSPLAYEIPMGPGEYQVELYFAEIFQPSGTGTGIGARVFDVEVEGQLVLDDFDILAETGGDINQPIIFTVPNNVSPDNFGNPEAIDIDLTASQDNAKISGIVVRDVTPPQPSGGAATLTINDGSNGIEASNFGNGSFSITNTGTKDISFIEIDVADALFPDAVFDPFGVAGDTTGKTLTLDGGSDGGTGLVVPAGGFGESAEGITYLGLGGAAGFEKTRLEFTDFNPGDTISFGVDMDPNSIAGAQKGTLDSGAGLAGAGGNNLWDVGGIGGAELSGGVFTVGFTDDTTSEGKLLGQGTGSQMGAVAQASQDSPNLNVVLTVNGLAEGEEGTYTDGGPQILIQGPAGETARVLVSKGFIVPFTNEFADSDPYKAQLDAQIAALEASGFPANNAVEMLYVDVPLDGNVQDISSLFDFTQVAAFDLSVPDADNEFGVLDEAQLPLGIVASVIDTANGQPLGSVTSPVHLTYAENTTPQIDPIADLSIGEGATAQIDIVATDVDNDPIALSVTLTRDIDGTEVDPASYAFTDNGDGTGSFSWLTGEPDDGAYTLEVTADDGNGETTVTASVIVNELPDPAPGTILYRVNAGGEEVAAADGGPAWSEDTQANNSPFLVNAGSNNDFPSNGVPNTSVDMTLLAGTGAVPEMIGIERWDNTTDAAGEMAWAFDVLEGTEVTVQLYLAELFSGLPDLDGSGDPTGDRIFDVSVDGLVPADFQGLDPYALAGNAFNTGAVVSHTLTSDGTIDLEFLHVSENTAIKGIEIVVAGTPDTTAPDATLDAANVGAAATAYQFTVTYDDASGIDVSTLDDLDITVSNGAIAFNTTATLAGIDVPADGAPRTATYEIVPPGGGWTPDDNGTYSIVLNDGEVADLFGNAAGETTLGTFEVALPVAAAGALIEITPDGGLGASTFGGSSFQVTNTSEPSVQITSVSINLSTGILPDMVFDPTGAGGDATASPLTANSGSVETGFVAPTDPAVDPFSAPRNGGFDVLDIAFTDFDPGEQFNFTTDVDPNNIQGVPGAGAAGAVSGYELAGATVSVTFSNGETLVGSLFEDGSLGGSQVLLEDSALAAPTIEVLGAGSDEIPSLPGDQVTVNGDPVIRVSGTPGDDIALLQMDSRLFIASGEPPFDVAADELPFYANEAMAGKAVYTGVIGPLGFVDIPVSFLTTAAATGPDGGLNQFIAVASDGPYAVDAATSQTSNVLTVKQGVPLLYDAAGVMEFDGTGSDVIELPHDPAWQVPAGTIALSFNADDTNGTQGLFSKDAGGFRGGGNHFALYLDGDTLTARLQNESTSNNLTFGGIVAGEEYEVAVTFGPAGAGLWVNGNLVDTTGFVMDWTQNAQFVQWGALGWSSDSGAPGFRSDLLYSGTISDKQVYGGELTASQIAALASTSSATNGAPTPIDDDIGTTEDIPVTVAVATLLSNDSDPDGDTPVFGGIATQPANGSAVYDGTSGEITYTPDPDFDGIDSFDITVEDGVGGSAQSTVTVNVAAANDDPVATDDADTVIINESVTIDLLANDVDVDGDTLSVINVGVAGLAGATVTDNGDGTITYQAGATLGEDTISYTVSDGNGGTSVGTISVAVLAEPNVDPIAENDPSYEVVEDGSLSIAAADGVLSNDSDPNGDPLTASVVTDVTNGTLSLAEDGSFVYTPDADFFGTDQFVYLASDGLGGTAQATATIDVTAVNDDPVAVDDNAQTSQSTPVEIDVLGNDTDVDGGTLTITGKTDGGFGAVEIAPDGSSLTYTPNTDSTGVDSFTYTVEDGNGGSDIATVNVVVSDETTPPLLYDAAGVMEFDGTGSDVIELPHDPAWQVPAGTIALSFNADDTNGTQGLFSKDAGGFRGGGNHFALYLDGDTLTARLQNESTSNNLTFGGIVAGEEYEVAVTFGPAGAGLWVNGNLVDTTGFVMDWTQNAQFVQWGALGWSSDSGAPGFRSDLLYSGTISDKQVYGGELTASQIAALASTSSATNGAPTPIDDDIGTTEDIPVTVAVATLLSNDSDPDGDTPVFGGIATQPANGSAVYDGTSGEITYTPDPDFDGIDSFDITVEDGVGGSAQSTVTVNVAAANDDPVATDDADTVIINESVTIDLLANDVDVDGDTLSVINVGVAGLAGATVTDNGDGTITYQAGATLGEDTISYTVSDGNGGTSVGTISVAVLAEPNVDPIAENDPSYEVVEDGSLSIAAADGVLSNDSDPNGDPLTASVVTDVTNGTLSLAEDGSFVYTPDADFFGTDQFVYLASDGLGGTAQATATIDVTAVNDDPVAVDDNAQTSQSTPVEIDVLGNDTDVDGGTLTITGKTDGGFGAVEIAPDGSSLTYTPNTDSTGVDSFTYTVEDGNGGSDIATVMVDVRETALPVFEQAGVEIYTGILGDVDNYAPTSALNIPAGTIALSFIADDTNGTQGLLSKDAGGFRGGGNHFSTYLDGDELFIRFQDASTTQTFSVENINVGQEYELAAIFSSNGVGVYLDGALTGESDTFVMNWESNEQWLNVGGLGWTSANADDAVTDPFNGSIADLQIFDEVLEESEIASLASGSSFDFI